MTFGELITRVDGYTQKLAEYINDLSFSVSQPKVWLSLSLIQLFFSQYIFSEWGFAIGFFIAFLCDTLAGIYIAWRQKTYSGKIMREKLADKSVAYFTIIIAYSAGTKIVLSGIDTNVIKYIDLPFYSIFITAEIFSIIKKWYEFKKWPVLAKLMSHFDGFNNLTGQKDENKQSRDSDPS
jgi:hypothetical protein